MKRVLYWAVLVLSLASFAAMTTQTAGAAKVKPTNTGLKVSCTNRVATLSQPIPVEERNAFLVSAMARFQAENSAKGIVPTADEETAFIESLKESAPVEVGYTVVMSDDSSLLPISQVDTDGTSKRFVDPDSVDDFADKVRQSGCETGVTNSSAFTASAVNTSSWSPTWYYCTAEAYVTSITGQKLLRLVQRQDWLVSVYGTVQDWDPVDVETYAYLTWKTSGSPSIVGPRWLTSPWQAYASAKQKFVNDYRIYTIQTKYLSTSITFGPANDCIMSPTKGPGM